MNEPQASEEIRLKHPEKVLPPDSNFLHHSVRPGEKRNIGFSMFEESYLTYSEHDKQLLDNLWQTVSENPDSYRAYVSSLSDPSLTEEETLFIARAAATVVALNGQQIGEGIANQEQFKILDQKRIKAYKDTDIGNVVSLTDIQGKGIIMCAEASLVGQGLSQYAKGYHVASADVVSRADTDLAEGHQINFLINDDESRVILFDMAYGVMREVSDKKMLMPYVALLTREQIMGFENGQNVTLESMGEKRVYRIGTRHTPPGTWRGNQLTSRSEAKN